MRDIHYVCKGAVCQCAFGSAPDTLEVKSQQKDYFNDNGEEKLVVTTKELGQTFTNNTFGSCAKMNNKPCKVMLTEWKEPWEKVTLSNGGKAVLETSTGRIRLCTYYLSWTNCSRDCAKLNPGR